ncbi:uncharacterized protein N7483_002616 [Penicillium malachiteum]|uniref:uncharacterized protein n=1 Tax=Penicillium malachiteum TaxID=1324776 RepID=UPI002548C920|nr:uncharacterized protein N7483_002616 [Penicillium malachiteum]KAJ5737491.1 hypothetical protein N7483_002616 [Penicillium malachiteum]
MPFVSALGGILVLLMTRVIYRVYFHPLRNIPGPKLAAATGLYEFYFNVIKRGKFIWEIERLHEIYGPIIRISPREVHIKDPEFFEEIYAPPSRPREKYSVFVKQFDIDHTAFTSVSAEAHRECRTPLNKFFSKSAITKIEPTIQRHLDILCGHIKSAFPSGRVVNLDSGFAGLMSDVIHEYMLGYHSGNLDTEDFNEHVRDGLNGILRLSHLNFFLPLMKLMKIIPMPVLKVLNPFAYAAQEMKCRIRECVLGFLSGKTDITKGAPVIKSVIDQLPAHLQGSQRLTDETFSLLNAATETTSRALSVAFFHIISNESIKIKLREELQSVMPTPDSHPTWDQLKQLPFLSGVVNECIRMSTGVAARSPRIAPNEALVYGEYIIPPGTPVSEIVHFIVHDPVIFPEPHSFDPERWIRAAEKGERLDRYLVNFSKGTRNCLGINLAYAELYITIARLVREFDFTLYKTTWKNLACARDFMAPYPEEGNMRFKVQVESVVSE